MEIKILGKCKKKEIFTLEKCYFVWYLCLYISKRTPNLEKGYVLSTHEK